MAKKVDENGWWIIKDNPLSKVGIYPYLGRQIDDSLEPNKIYRVYRPAEELLNEETVKSFNLVPLINDHEMLGKDYKPAEEKGVDGIIYNPRVVHGDMLIGNIKIYSEKMMKDIKNGKKELSMGYTCMYDITPGDWDGQPYDVVQRNLRGNHVALVDKGRMGSDVRVYDKHICCDSMNIFVDKIKKISAKDLSPETVDLRKKLNRNYVTKSGEKKVNSLIKKAALPISRKTEATKMFGTSTYRDRFDAAYAPIVKWIKSQELRFDNTRKKVGIKKLQEMPSYKKYMDKFKDKELNEIINLRKAIEKTVYGARAETNDSWIKVPKQEQEEPNIISKAISQSFKKSTEMATMIAILDLFNRKEREKEKIILRELKKSSAKDAIFATAGRVAGAGIQFSGYALGKATVLAGKVAQTLATKSINAVGSILNVGGRIGSKAGQTIQNKATSNWTELAALGGGLYLYNRHKKKKELNRLQQQQQEN